MIKVTIMEQPRMNGVNWWRVFRPFSRLQRTNPDTIEVRYEGTNIQIVQLMFTDILFLARPHTKEHVTVMQRAKEMGCRVIIDYDDDLKHIPMHNPAYGLFDAKNIDKCIELADHIWLSTSPLIEAMGIPMGKTTIIPNAILPTEIVDEPNRGTGIVIWRGSPSHARDVQMHMEFYHAVLQWAKAVVFMGYMPPSIPPHEKLTYIPWKDVQDFHSVLYTLKPEFFWVPLEENTFNRCKSNIAYLEATMCGARVLTNVKEWDIPDTWEQACTDVVNNFDLEMMTAKRLSDIIDVYSKK